MSDSGPLNLAAYRFFDALARDAIARNQPVSLESSALIANLGGTAPVASLIARLVRDPLRLTVVSVIPVSEAVERRARQLDHREIGRVLSSFHTVPNLVVQ